MSDEGKALVSSLGPGLLVALCTGGAMGFLARVALVTELAPAVVAGALVFGPAAAAGFLVGVRWYRAELRRLRVLQALCPTCGFNLVQSSERCPECGEVTAWTPRKAPGLGGQSGGAGGCGGG